MDATEGTLIIFAAFFVGRIAAATADAIIEYRNMRAKLRRARFIARVLNG